MQKGIKKHHQTVNTQVAFAFTNIHSNYTEWQCVLRKLQCRWLRLRRKDGYSALHSKSVVEWQWQDLPWVIALHTPYLNIITHLGAWPFLVWSPACPSNSTWQITAPAYSKVCNTPSQSRWSNSPSWPCRSTNKQIGFEWLQRTSFCPLQGQIIMDPFAFCPPTFLVKTIFFTCCLQTTAM